MKNTTAARNVKHQPLPMPSIIWITTAVPTAPIRHLTRLFAAVAVAGLNGYRSTSRVLITSEREPDQELQHQRPREGSILFQRLTVGQGCHDAEKEQRPDDLDARFLKREVLRVVALFEVDAETGVVGAASVVEVHEVAAGDGGCCAAYAQGDEA